MKTEKDCKKNCLDRVCASFDIRFNVTICFEKKVVLRVNEGKWGPSIQVMKGLDSALEKESFDTNALCTSKAQSLK